ASKGGLGKDLQAQASRAICGGRRDTGGWGLMALSTAVMTDERAAFAEALRDFAQRECGTQEQRAALTNGYRDGHNQELYARLGELGYIGCCLPERYGGAGGGTI